MFKTWLMIHMRIGIVLTPIRIQIGIKTMPIHNTDGNSHSTVRVFFKLL